MFKTILKPKNILKIFWQVSWKQSAKRETQMKYFGSDNDIIVDLKWICTMDLHFLGLQVGIKQKSEI